MNLLIISTHLLIFAIGYSMGKRKMSSQKEFLYPDLDEGWISIDKTPIPDEFFEEWGRPIVVTDGKTAIETCTLSCDRKGRPVFGYGDKKLVTAWRLPLKAPKNNQNQKRKPND